MNKNLKSILYLMTCLVAIIIIFNLKINFSYLMVVLLWLFLYILYSFNMIPHNKFLDKLLSEHSISLKILIPLSIFIFNDSFLICFAKIIIILSITLIFRGELGWKHVMSIKDNIFISPTVHYASPDEFRLFNGSSSNGRNNTSTNISNTSNTTIPINDSGTNISNVRPDIRPNIPRITNHWERDSAEWVNYLGGTMDRNVGPRGPTLAPMNTSYPPRGVIIQGGPDRSTGHLPAPDNPPAPDTLTRQYRQALKNPQNVVVEGYDNRNITNQPEAQQVAAALESGLPLNNYTLNYYRSYLHHHDPEKLWWNQTGKFIDRSDHMTNELKRVR